MLCELKLIRIISNKVAKSPLRRSPCLSTRYLTQQTLKFTLALSFLPTEEGYPEHLAPLDPSSIDPSLPLPSPLVPPKTPPRPSTSDYISSDWAQPPSKPQESMTRSRSSSTSSTSSSNSTSSSLYETDSEADNEAQLQFEESVRQLQSLVNLVVVPWVSRYFGRKWSYYRMSTSLNPLSVGL